MKLAPRTVRDRIHDSVAVLVALVVGVLFFVGNYTSTVGGTSDWQANVDWIVGAVAIAAIWWRRAAPVHVGVFTAVLSVVSSAAAAASVVALFTVAIHRRWPAVAAVAVVNLATGAVYPLYRPQDMSFLWSTVLNVGVALIVVAWGMYVRARRQLVLTLRERAERAEAEQRMLAERARLAERTRIAREMHDVLAHRISLLALHAGGLQLRPDLPAEQVRETADLLAATAHRALEELRGVIGVLRDGDAADADPPAAPQPTLRDIGRLVDDTRRTGARIAFASDVPADAEPPGAIGRDAYRIVQEALTNVAKHARGTATTVEIHGAPGADLRVAVRNRLPVAAPAGPALPSAGAGLVGLQERVALAGGTLRHGPTEHGEFEVDALLAWPGP